MNTSIYKQLVDNHFDWYYLLNLERYKIKQMIKSFSKAKHYVDWECDVRDMKLCVALIDIICENDSISKKAVSEGVDFTHQKLLFIVGSVSFKN